MGDREALGVDQRGLGHEGRAEVERLGEGEGRGLPGERRRGPGLAEGEARPGGDGGAAPGERGAGAVERVAGEVGEEHRPVERGSAGAGGEPQGVAGGVLLDLVEEGGHLDPQSSARRPPAPRAQSPAIARAAARRGGGPARAR